MKAKCIKVIKKYFCIIEIMCVCFMCGCNYNIKNNVDIATVLSNEDYKKSKNEVEFFFKDDNSLYVNDEQVKVLYLTVGYGKRDNDTDHTWSELSTLYQNESNNEVLDDIQCEAVVQFGNEDGPTSNEYGFDATGYNATIKLSGEKSAKHPQKNYRIKIKDGFGSINGIKTFVLSKSFTDPFRITNKLCYELMEDIPDLLSVRTNFVHLYVKDVSERADTKFVDYGMYTMVEGINKKYFKNRGLDNSGELYKVNDFDWGRHEDVIVQPTDRSYNKEEFEKYLESKGDNDFSDLLEALADVNDYSIPIEDVVDKHFDKNNLYSWMAFNILMDNRATGTENYYIYNPVASNKLYFISWDNDGALRKDYKTMKKPNEGTGWKEGIYIYSNSVLFKRILQSEHCTNELSEVIHKLHENELKAEVVTQKALELSDTAREYIYKFPDRSYAIVTEPEYELLIEKLTEQIDDNYYAYYDTLESPWPFGIYEPSNSNGNAIIKWEESFALNQNVTYSIELDDSWSFSSPIISDNGISDTSYNLGALSKGQYFVRIKAIADNGNEQISKSFYNTEKKTKENGVYCFYVLEDGSIKELVFKD